MVTTISLQIEGLEIDSPVEDVTLQLVEDAAYEFVGGGMLANGI